MAATALRALLEVPVVLEVVEQPQAVLPRLLKLLPGDGRWSICHSSECSGLDVVSTSSLILPQHLLAQGLVLDFGLLWSLRVLVRLGAQDALPGTLSVVTDANGQQVEYNGHMLYKYSGDTAPGQTHGEGIKGNGLWLQLR